MIIDGAHNRALYFPYTIQVYSVIHNRKNEYDSGTLLSYTPEEVSVLLGC